MNSEAFRNTVARVSTLVLLLALVPGPSAQAAPGGRLEGTLVGVDGTPAAGHHVHLIDAAGRGVARARTTREGRYVFDRVPAAEYVLGIENPDGQMAPVAAPPMRVDGGAVVERDIRLLEDDGTGRAAATGNYALGTWWQSLGLASKIWVVVGTLTVIGITAVALDDEDDVSPSVTTTP